MVWVLPVTMLGPLSKERDWDKVMQSLILCQALEVRLSGQGHLRRERRPLVLQASFYRAQSQTSAYVALADWMSPTCVF